MAGINILSENLTDNATFSITTGTENAQFPLTNLVNNTTTKKFRSVGNTVVIVVDLLQTRQIDTFAVVGDATGQLGLTALSIKTSVTTDFSGSPVIPINLSVEENIGYEFITSVNHRYVEITATGSGSYVEMSKVFIGVRTNLPELSLSIDSFGYGHRDRSQSRENEYGQKFINKRNKTKLIRGNFEFATKDEHETLDDIFNAHGTSEPLWVIVDPNSDAMNDGQYKLAMYGYLDAVPEWSNSGGQQWNAPMAMSEVI